MSLLITIVTFIIILAALVLVHEFGHFIVAKLFKIRVDEFALGFPPKIYGKKFGETEYVLNSVPFGGYVKIFGENPDEESIGGPDSHRSFVNKSKWIQVAVLVAGIAFNILFAWGLFSVSLMSGFPTPTDSYTDTSVKNIHLSIVDISPGSPAQKAGLVAGDTITSINVEGSEIRGTDLTVERVQQLISGSNGKSISIHYTESGTPKSVSINAVPGIVKDKLGIGIAMSLLGTTKLPIHKAIWQGGKITISTTGQIAGGLYTFFKEIVVGHPNFSQVSGPIGIVGLVGEASRFGFFYLLSFTALISLNLALINLLPFPALDGGRVLFVIIEAIKGSPIKPKVANAVNATGFALLILLMLVVTYKDIVKLFIK